MSIDVITNAIIRPESGCRNLRLWSSELLILISLFEIQMIDYLLSAIDDRLSINLYVNGYKD